MIDIFVCPSNFILLFSKFKVIAISALLILTGLASNVLSVDSLGDREAKQEPKLHENVQITIDIIPSANNTYGYDIFISGRPLIHQPNIPALPGNEGFTTKEKAQMVAEFVVKKIRHNEMPPTVTTEDLNALGVLR